MNTWHKLYHLIWPINYKQYKILQIYKFLDNFNENIIYNFFVIKLKFSIFIRYKVIEKKCRLFCLGFYEPFAITRYYNTQIYHMEAFEPKWVNPYDIQYGVNSLRLEGLQVVLHIIGTRVTWSTLYCDYNHLCYGK